MPYAKEMSINTKERRWTLTLHYLQINQTVAKTLSCKTLRRKHWGNPYDIGFEYKLQDITAKGIGKKRKGKSEKMSTSCLVMD